jgi:hypothetical protein
MTTKLTRNQNIEQVEVQFTKLLSQLMQQHKVSVHRLNMRTNVNIQSVLQSAHMVNLDTMASLFYELGYQLIFDVKKLG